MKKMLFMILLLAVGNTSFATEQNALVEYDFCIENELDKVEKLDVSSEMIRVCTRKLQSLGFDWFQIDEALDIRRYHGAAPSRRYEVLMSLRTCADQRVERQNSHVEDVARFWQLQIDSCVADSVDNHPLRFTPSELRDARSLLVN